MTRKGHPEAYAADRKNFVRPHLSEMTIHCLFIRDIQVRLALHSDFYGCAFFLLYKASILLTMRIQKIMTPVRARISWFV
jgi:hypothetical protein